MTERKVFETNLTGVRITSISVCFHSFWFSRKTKRKCVSGLLLLSLPSHNFSAKMRMVSAAVLVVVVVCLLYVLQISLSILCVNGAVFGLISIVLLYHMLVEQVLTYGECFVREKHKK